VRPSILPDEDASELTTFVLSLSLDQQGLHALSHKLRLLDGATLLFLRRLRRMNVVVNGHEILSHHLCFGKGHSLSHAKIHTTRDGHTTVSKYLYQQKDIGGLPEHDKRPRQESTVILAFPVSDTGPVLQCQDIYVYLPLRRTSFYVHFLCDFSNSSVSDTRRFYNSI